MKTTGGSRRCYKPRSAPLTACALARDPASEEAVYKSNILVPTWPRGDTTRDEARSTDKRFASLDFNAIATRGGRVELVCEAPPVYVVHNFLPAEVCEQAIALGARGDVPTLEYWGNNADFDTSRIVPGLAGICLLESIVHTMFHPSATAMEAALHAVGTGAGLGFLSVALLFAVNLHLRMSNSKVFTGTKWKLKGQSAGREVERRLLDSAGAALAVSARRFEPVTLTRYCKGQHQMVHNDALKQPTLVSKEEAAEWVCAHCNGGGQRVAQVLVYLNDGVQGGGTTFLDVKGREGGLLTVKPEAGKALIFFPSELNGTPMDIPHRGDAVEGDVPKWSLNTWMLQHEPKQTGNHPPV